MSDSFPSPRPDDVPHRVLVIEDDHSIARLICYNLTKHGLEAFYVPDPYEGLAKFKQSNPHLVLLDLNLPSMHGHDVCTRIREISTVPIIMMTANDSVDAQAHGFEVGADDYIPKPFDPVLLAGRVQAHLRRVYKYDAPAKIDNSLDETPPVRLVNSLKTGSLNPNTSFLPDGWGRCEKCAYLGPHEKFDKINSRGEHSLECPHCQGRDRIVFTLS